MKHRTKLNQRRRGGQPPRGGVWVRAGKVQAWRWNGEVVPVTARVRCEREQWYLVRAQPSSEARPSRAEVWFRFWRRDEHIGARVVSLQPVAEQPVGGQLLGWLHTPTQVTHMQLGMPDAALPGRLEEVRVHPVGDCTPNCHPLANVPRWGVYQPPFPLERVVLPPTLADLAPLLGGQRVDVARPRSITDLARHARFAACVVDPAWIDDLGLTWPALERLAAESWLVVDLETIARLLRQARLVETAVVERTSRHGIMAARVEYADVPTRGFALQDVFPYGTVAEAGGFATRALRADRRWKSYADRVGFATLLASTTPSTRGRGDVLSAGRPVGRGELIATDLPWLVAGRLGPLVAPRVARHALRMHLGGFLHDALQYWNRWEDTTILVRDIADLPRRYPPLQTLRWAAPEDGLAHLGLALSAVDRDAPARGTLVLSTGRIDHEGLHDGVPPEPMIIFMKMRARDVREHAPWAARYLRDLTVIWQFDTATGQRYALNYQSAAWFGGTARVVRLRRAGTDSSGEPGAERAGVSVSLITDDEGMLGDGSLEYQARLDARLRGLIEQCAKP